MLEYKSLMQGRHGLCLARLRVQNSLTVFYTYSFQALANGLKLRDLKAGKISGIRLECSV